MEQEKLDKLAANGIDVEGALERFMGNSSLLDRFLNNFLDDPTYENLKQAVAEKDAEKMLSTSHLLKGMCANLSMTNLTELFTRQVRLLRENRQDDAAAMMNEIDAEYKRIVSLIKE